MTVANGGEKLQRLGRGYRESVGWAQERVE